MRRGYVSLKSGKQVHYRTSGEGPALIILHPSPQSSAAMTAALNAFSSSCACFAFDTPGYGLSDPMGAEEPTIGDYAESLVEAAGALGIDAFFVYGAATGSQLAIEMAKRYPDRVRFVLLDSNGHISDDMCERLVASGYFADTAPRRDGGHLLAYWDMCRHLFHAFPWNSGLEADRLSYDISPPEVIHDTFLRYLQAGEGYSIAYKAALYTERRGHFDGMTTPAVMTRWASSPVLSIADALIALGLPDNVRVLEAGYGVEARFSVQIDALRAMIAETSPPSAELVSAKRRDGGEGVLHRAYLSSGQGQLHVRMNGITAGVPLVILHGAARSGSQLVDLAGKVSEERRVILIDLPGHGASPDLPGGESISVDAFATPIASALQELNAAEVDMIGEGLGGAVGIAITEKVRTRRLIILDAIPYTGVERETAEDNGLPDLTPRDDGAHLVSAWSVARDNALFFPFWDRRADAMRKGDADLSPQNLHARAVDILRLGAYWREVMFLEVRLEWGKLLEGSNIEDVTVCSTDQHPCPDRLEAGLFSNTQRVPLCDLDLRP